MFLQNKIRVFVEVNNYSPNGKKPHIQTQNPVGAYCIRPFFGRMQYAPTLVSNFILHSQYCKQKTTEKISISLKFPVSERDSNIQGRIIVNFVVNEDGSVSEAMIIRKGVSPNMDKEALRVVKLLHFKHGKQQGKAVKMNYTLPIKY